MANLTVPFQTTVVYEEIHGSRREDLSDQGIRGSRTLKCAWADRITLARDLRGYTEPSGTDQIIHLPQVLPGWSNVPVSAVSISGFGASSSDGGNTTIASYAHALLDVTYQPNGSEDNQGGDNPFASESIEGAAEFLKLSSEKLYWDNAQTEPVLDAEAPGRLIRMLDWTIQIEEMASLPSDLFSLVGYVNQNSAISPRFGYQFEAETLLLQPPRIRRKITTDGTGTWAVDIKLTFRPGGWNKFFRSGQTTSGVWNPVPMYDSSGNELKTYPTGDFATLLGLIA